ncbi:MAG: glucose-1-phosphate adenylyltransferase [Clostridiales bacterium]|jgi:glucose-1-phosphate adenylyltransferase|nr:glucose-1-phosphate adenylyltransferase [Clostridiales bacterium]
MRKKEMIAMLLAGGQGSRLGVLTFNTAKPAVPFGGKYRIIDFPMSNCINSGVDTVGVLTQYQPLLLNRHIGIGIPWDLDRRNGGVTILAPHVKGAQGEWYTGTANAIYQNLEYINEYNPEYVLILSGDHIYKMDYSRMLDFHKKKKCDVTIAVLEVPMEEASRFGIMNAREDDRIYEFEEKPAQPKSNLASMGIYIFAWDKLKEALIYDNKLHDNSDFGKHIIPLMLNNGMTMYAYRFKDYWKDVGTIESYWAANMELIRTLPDFNLYEDFWKIYTDADHQPPLYVGPDAEIKTSLVSEGCEVYGAVRNSVLGPEVSVGEGATVRDSIIMTGCSISPGCVLDRCIIDEGSELGRNVVIGCGDNTPNSDWPKIYDTGITVIGEHSVVPDNVRVGKNCVIYGRTAQEHYQNGSLDSGGSVVLVKEVTI